MTPKPTGWDELHLAENPAVELLESLGYTYVPPESLEGERASFRETILTDRLAAAVERLNPWLSATNVAAAVKAVTQVPAASLAEANRKIYTSLTYGIALEQDRGDGRKSHTVRFLDFDHSDRNEWIVTRQYRVLGSNELPDSHKAFILNDLHAVPWPQFTHRFPLSEPESTGPFETFSAFQRNAGEVPEVTRGKA